MALLMVGLCADVLAADKEEFPRVTFVGVGNGKGPVDRDQFLLLVVEGPYLSYEANPIPGDGVVEYVNNLLKSRKVSYIGMHIREGTKYGDVVKAIDLLRKTDAKNIGVSMIELAVGRTP